jgi:peroxiredoxin Q/BCP
LSAVRETYAEFQELDTVAYGVNEGDAASHTQFKDQLNLPYELLVDEGLKVAETYGALKPEGGSISRTVVIVGKNGKVIYRAPGAPPPGELLAEIRTANEAYSGT